MQDSFHELYDFERTLHFRRMNNFRRMRFSTDSGISGDHGSQTSWLGQAGRVNPGELWCIIFVSEHRLDKILSFEEIIVEHWNEQICTIPWDKGVVLLDLGLWRETRGDKILFNRFLDRGFVLPDFCWMLTYQVLGVLLSGPWCTGYPSKIFNPAVFGNPSIFLQPAIPVDFFASSNPYLHSSL